MADEKQSVDEAARKAGQPAEVVSYWLKEISAARKREKDFRKEGQRIIDIYEGQKKDEVPFNILYSNTETMLPALYSSTPRPVVQRRFKDDDPLGKFAATAGQRMLEFLLDTNIDGYETVDSAMKAATLAGLLPGRGVTSLLYEAEFGTLPAATTPAVPAAETSPEDAAEDAADPKEATKPDEYKASETICVNARQWNRVFHGYAKKWSNVPWVAYEEHIDEKEATRLFGKAKADKLVFTTGDDREKERDDETERTEDENDIGARKTCLIYQIWDKSGGRKVRYISPQYHDGYLSVKDDPLELTGFFDCPEPLSFVDKVNDLLPVPLYVLYENQAKELNRITVRINRIVEALKARGVYDTELGEDIGTLMQADDNALVPADKSSSLSAEKGLQNAIWFMPLDVLVGVLEKLYLAREQCKQVIYEINGIADILRGSTKASETFGAQKLKSEWGTLRLKPKQKEVQRYARDILRMMLEIAATKFSEETWAKMTGLPFLLEPKYNELTAVANALKAKVQQEQMQAQIMAAQAAQQGGGASPQQPPQQPQPSQTVQQLQQVMQQLQAPRWSDILGMLRDDMQRAYRIDIETNSTVEPEAVEDQKNISEVMTALGQFLNGITPLVVNGSMPFQAAQAMMLSIVRRFRFGTEIEDYIKAMQAPKPPDDGKAGEAAKMQAEQAKMQAEQQNKQADRAFEMEKAKAEEERARATEMAAHQREVQAAQDARETEAARILAERETKRMEIDAERSSELAKLQAQRATEEMKARTQQETELQKAAIAAAAQIEIAKINATVTAESNAKADGENEKREAGEAQSAEAMQQSIATMAEALRIMAAPKKAERDKNGRIIQLVPQVGTTPAH